MSNTKKKIGIQLGKVTWLGRRVLDSRSGEPILWRKSYKRRNCCAKERILPTTNDTALPISNKFVFLTFSLHNNSLNVLVMFIS